MVTNGSSQIPYEKSDHYGPLGEASPLVSEHIIEEAHTGTEVAVITLETR